MVDPKLHPSEVVTIAPDVPLRLLEAIRAALAELDQIHHLPKKVQAHVEATRKRYERGCYDPAAAKIAVSRFTPNPMATFIHEFGHFLDNRIMHPLHRDYASRYEDEFVELLARCLKSKPLAEIEKILRTRRSQISRSDVTFLRDLAQVHEIFARVYLQWVYFKSQNEIFREKLRPRIETVEKFADLQCHLHWDRPELDDIMNAVDRLFKLKGLI